MRTEFGIAANLSICEKCPRSSGESMSNRIEYFYCNRWFGKHDDGKSVVGIKLDGITMPPAAYTIPKDCNFRLEQILDSEE